MKMLDKDKIAKENLEDDVLSEVRSMKLVHHPYIVRLFEVLKTNKKISFHYCIEKQYAGRKFLYS